MILTQAQAVERCRYWQGVLRLLDWDIEIKIARRIDMHSPSVAAQIWVATCMRTATITLLDPTDLRRDASAREADMEDSIVHELLHLHMNDLRVDKAGDGKPPTAIEIAEERAVDAIADAFIRLERRGAR